MSLNLNQWKVLWFFFRSYKAEGMVVLGFMLCSGLLETLNLAALYPVINYGLHLEKADFFTRTFESIASHIIASNPFMSACIVLIAISIVSLMFKFIYTYLSNRLLTRIIGQTQAQIFENLSRAPYDFYVKSQQGKLIYASAQAPEKTTVAILYTLTLFYHSINAVFMFALLMLLSWQATIGILLVGVFYGVVIKKVMDKYINSCARVSVQENQRKNIILNEFIGGIKSIRIFQAIGAWQTRYTEAIDVGLRNQFHLLVASGVPETFVKFIFFVLIGITGIAFSHKSPSEIMILLPVLGTFVLVVNRFLPSIHVLGSAVLKIAECIPDTKIVYDLCHEHFQKESDGTRPLNGFRSAICFNGVSFKYETSTEDVLKDVSFRIEHKKMTALVGRSGSGKTTIINLLLKLYATQKGSITIDGIPLNELKNSTYLSRIGYVSQETFLFNASIKDNIRFGLQSCTEEMIEEAAKLANAHEFIIETPQKYDTLVGDAGIKLSGGQKQRIAIARAMLRRPDIIIFDEATSSLDNISEKKIQKAINAISQQTTVLVIAHRLSTVEHADKIIILDAGQVKEQGTHTELLNNKSLYFNLHQSSQTADECVKESIG